MIRIGIDLDGVIFDSERNLRVLEEIYAIEELGNKKLINKEGTYYKSRYDWTEEEGKNFVDKYYVKGSNMSNLMAGFKLVYDRLKRMDVKLIAITARGGLNPKMIDAAKSLLEKNNIEFDNIYWNVKDKASICIKENINVMIDDNHNHIKAISDNKIRTLYFRDSYMKKLEENEYIKEVNGWGEIYRYIYEQLNKKEG